MDGRSYSSMDYGTPHKLRMYVQCCFTSTETVRTVRDGEPRTATSTFTQLLSSTDIQIQCCFTSTETVRTILDREPRAPTSSFTQVLSSDELTRGALWFNASSVGLFVESAQNLTPMEISARAQSLANT